MNIIEFFHSNISPDLLTLLSSVIFIIIILVVLKLYKLDGLKIYLCTGFIACNIQVMKGSVFFFSKDPIPLGTLTYGTISIVISIITEFFGNNEAKKAIWLGFLSNIIFNIIIFITLIYKPADISLVSDDLKFLCNNHDNMFSIFYIMPSIFISSLTAYLCSEFLTSFMQNFLKKIFNSKFLLLRTYIANIIGAFCDLIIMNYMAWFLLNPNPINLKDIFFIYILASYPFRIFSSLISIPIMFFAKKIINKNNSII